MSFERPHGPVELEKVVDDLVIGINERERAQVYPSGIVIRGLVLTTSNTEVRHALGRTPDWVVAIKKNANATVFVDTEHGDPRNFVYVKASAAVTVNLLVS